MNPSDEQIGTEVPDGGGAPSATTSATTSATQEPASSPTAVTEVALRSRRPGGGKPPPPPPSGGDGDGDDDGMLRMSFMDHLEELRSRIIRALMGIAVAFVGSIFFTKPLWNVIKAPATDALKTLGYPPHLVAIDPMEQFNIIWFKLPVVCAIFIASPWVFYQIWAFISPGLYRRERRWAAPFVLSSAGLFIMGGCFAYFVAFRFGLTFLLGIGQGDMDVVPMISITHYFDLFVDVMLGIGVVFELPILIFLLILLKIVTPAFLIAHSRYAILGIFIIAAIVTPTPDVFNMMLFATPMCILFYFGVFAGYLLVLHREKRRFPWRKAMTIVIPVLLLLALIIYVAVAKFGVRLVPHAPFITR
jgi:sec-independent protein translocase protein TatC